MTFVEEHFVGVSIVFIISLFIISVTVILSLSLINEILKTYLNHKRFLTTFLVTQEKEDRQKEIKKKEVINEEKTN